MPVRFTQFKWVTLTEATLCAWTCAAAPGDHLVYHRWFLSWDLAPELSVLSKPQRAALSRLASRARQLSEQGLIHLVQRREGMGDYTYLIVMRPRLRAPCTGVLQRVLSGAQAVLA